jgi:hypothetical protein
MPTVKLVAEDDPNPLVQEVFRDIKETKKIDKVPSIWRALATHPEHLSLYYSFLGSCFCSKISRPLEQGFSVWLVWRMTRLQREFGLWR